MLLQECICFDLDPTFVRAEKNTGAQQGVTRPWSGVTTKYSVSDVKSEVTTKHNDGTMVKEVKLGKEKG